VHVAGVDSSDGAGRTTWFRRDTPLRRFLRAETGSGAVLLVAAVGALIWVNVDAASYDNVWHKRLAVVLGNSGISMDLRGWVNSGLMTFFFFVVGLEARREFDIGEFRDRRRVVLPVLAGVGGMIAAVSLYLAVNAGRSSAQGWGVAMSTDTAFALGVLGLLSRRVPDRIRSLILTVTVVDDIVGLFVIATV
jgi:Na+/H+ antiporter NhaA